MSIWLCSLSYLKSANFEDTKTIQRQEIIQFTNDGTANQNIAISSRSRPTPVQTESVSDTQVHTITSFLKRPMIMSNVHWETSAVASQILARYSVPYEVFRKPMYKEKLSKFTAIRSDFHFRIQVNATPFNAGRLLIVWVPFTDYMSEKGKWLTQNIDKKNEMLTTWTGCPHVDLDIATHTEAQLVVPFSSISEYYNLITGEYNLGNLLIVCYSPLTGTPSKVDLTTWVHMDNIKLVYPTGAKSIVMETDTLSKSFTQAGEEQEAIETNSDIKLSSVIDIVQPVLDKSTLPAVIPWAASRASEYLKLFGYSKPVNAEVNKPLRLQQTKFMANYDGEDTSHSLGISSKNTLLSTDFNSNEKDEMSIAYITRKLNYLTTFSWSTSQQYDTQLWNWRVNPMMVKVLDETNQIVQPTHLAYVSQMYNLWRGGIKFVFKVVKTKFHSGRLRIAFEPMTTSDKQNNILANYTKVVDLRNETEFEFVVPYINQSSWMYVDPDAMFETWTNHRTTGNISVYILNDLVAPSVVSDTVQVLVEVCGADDFELAAPTYSAYVPYIKANPPSAEKQVVRTIRSIMDLTSTPATMTQTLKNIVKEVTPSSNYKQFVESSWDTLPDSQKQNLCNMKIPDKSYCQAGQEFNVNTLTVGQIETCAQTVGEKNESINQLLKRFYLFTLEKDFSGNETTLNFNTFYFKPPVGMEPVSNDSDILLTPLDYFAPIFSFYRGSIRFKFFWYNHLECGLIASNQTYWDRIGFPNYPKNGMGVWTAAQDGANYNRRGATVVAVPIENVLEVNLPYYSRNALAVSSSKPVHYTDSLGIVPHSVLTLSPMTKKIRSVSVDIGVHGFKSAGDDFQFSGLIGCPPLQSYLKAPLS